MLLKGQTETERIEQLERLLAQAKELITDQRTEIARLEQEVNDFRAIYGNLQNKLAAITDKLGW